MSTITMTQCKSGSWKVLRNGKPISYHLLREARREVV